MSTISTRFYQTSYYYDGMTNIIIALAIVVAFA